MSIKKTYITISFIIAVIIFTPLALMADNGTPPLIKGQTLYVPAYSHIYSGNTEKPFLLTVTLSIRNIDLNESIQITAVKYYETQGELLKNYVKEKIVLNPLESIRFVIPEKDKSGGSGANFIVKWDAQTEVNPPVVETIMIGAQLQQGISFTSRAVEIIEKD